MIYRILGLLILFALSPFSGSSLSRPILAQVVETSEIRGDVTQIEGNTMYVDTAEGVRQISVPDNVKVTKNSVDSQMSQIQPGDQVAVTQSSNGEVLGVAASSESIGTLSRFALPIAIGVIVLLGLTAWLIRKSQQGQIKTEIKRTP